MLGKPETNHATFARLVVSLGATRQVKVGPREDALARTAATRHHANADRTPALHA